MIDRIPPSVIRELFAFIDREPEFMREVSVPVCHPDILRAAYSEYGLIERIYVHPHRKVAFVTFVRMEDALFAALHPPVVPSTTDISFSLPLALPSPPARPAPVW